MDLETKALKLFLDARMAAYFHPGFVDDDPICVPHRYSKMQDIEIAGFFSSILAWGQRTTIIRNSLRLMQLMDNSPHDFVLHHKPEDLKSMLGFVHRTFNATDLLYLIDFLHRHYQVSETLESAFVPVVGNNAGDAGAALVHFHNYCFSVAHPDRTRKHIATPARHSACKRMNMFLRWMVRHDESGIDFGIWKVLKPAQLICPLDTHVARVAYRLGIIPDLKSNWTNAVILTRKLQELDPTDPVRYDVALFALGRHERF